MFLLKCKVNVRSIYGRMFTMTLGSVTSANLMYGMTGYNGLGFMGGTYGGYGIYGGYGMNDGSVSLYQNNVQNGYDIWQTQNGYQNKPGVETMTINNQCQDIGMLITAGRTDDASKEIEKLVDELKQYPQYANYSDKEIRSVVRNTYQNATGSDIINDIEVSTSNNFVQGIKQGLPLGGLCANKTTRADLVEQVTGVPKSKGEKAAERIGAMTASAATYGAIGFTVSGFNPLGAAVGAAIGAGIGFIKAIIPSSKK